jgi:peptidoglycan hydrolase CwlO-like protein
MKVNKQTILLVIIAILAGYTIFQSQGIKTDVAGYNAKIESIQKEIDSVQLENHKINEQIVTIDKDIDMVGDNINNVTKNITLIKTETDEKVNSITTIGNIELEQLFANRYN